MKRTILFLILISISALISCGPKPPTENEKLREEVIAVHDEVMPKMGQLKSLQRKALDKVEELEAAEPVDSIKVKELKSLAYELDLAYKHMYDWMHEYAEKVDTTLTEEEVKEFLDHSMVFITEVNEEIKSVLEKSNEVLSD